AIPNIVREHLDWFQDCDARRLLPDSVISACGRARLAQFYFSQGKTMKAFILSCVLTIAFVATGFGKIGDDEKQIESVYGKPA
ncbi:MAG: hypothetical protein DME57_06915, partial [Verrucomicrobia bacterium]